jgi:hypothetical protein
MVAFPPPDVGARKVSDFPSRAAAFRLLGQLLVVPGKRPDHIHKRVRVLQLEIGLAIQLAEK